MKHQAKAVAVPRSGTLAVGIGFTLMSSLCLAVVSTLAKAVSSELSPVAIVFFQYALSFLLLLPWLLRGGLANLRTHRLGLLIIWSIFGLSSQLLMFIALASIPLVDAVLLANSSPLFIPLVVLAWEHTPIARALWVSLAIGFVGVMLILQPGAGVLSGAILLALAAGACSAIGLVTISRLESTEPPQRMLFWYLLVSSLLTAPVWYVRWPAPSPSGWISLVGLGIAMALAQILTIRAYTTASPAQLAPFNYSVVVFSALIGWAIWREVPNWLTIVGILLVSAGGVVSTVQHGAGPTHPPLPSPAIADHIRRYRRAHAE